MITIQQIDLALDKLKAHVNDYNALLQRYTEQPGSAYTNAPTVRLVWWRRMLQKIMPSVID